MIAIPRARIRRSIVVGCFAFAATLAGGLTWSDTAMGGEPVAIVESINAASANVRFMDYVPPRRVIDLGPNGKLILGYLRSCLRERITGGRVTVGRERSRVDGGAVVRERVECDGGDARLTAEQAATSGTLVLRRPPKPRSADLPAADSGSKARGL